MVSQETVSRYFSGTGFPNLCNVKNLTKNRRQHSTKGENIAEMVIVNNVYKMDSILLRYSRDWACLCKARMC